MCAYVIDIPARFATCFLLTCRMPDHFDCNPKSTLLKLNSMPFGKYLITPQLLPPGSYISQIRQGGRSILDSGVIVKEFRSRFNFVAN